MPDQEIVRYVVVATSGDTEYRLRGGTLTKTALDKSQRIIGGLVLKAAGKEEGWQKGTIVAQGLTALEIDGRWELEQNRGFDDLEQQSPNQGPLNLIAAIENVLNDPNGLPPFIKSRI